VKPYELKRLIFHELEVSFVFNHHHPANIVENRIADHPSSRNDQVSVMHYLTSVFKLGYSEV
jgi:hypothetical protein